MDAHTPSSISFVVPGVPVPWARAGSKAGIRYTPAKQRSAMGEVKTLARVAMGSMKPFDGPVRLDITATWPHPASWSAKKRCQVKWRPGRPDADNVGKLVADSLNGIAWLDDAQVVILVVCKFYGDRAELAVRIDRLG